MIGMDVAARYLEAYDRQLRTARTGAVIREARVGPLHLITFERGRGFVTYRDLGEAGPEGTEALVVAALDHFRRERAIERVDWKTCVHDQDAGLREALVGQGFQVRGTGIDHGG